MLSMIGAALGFFTSLVPDVFKYFQDKSDKAHELAMMDKMRETQVAIGAQKLEATIAEGDAKHIVAGLKNQTTMTKDASQWVVNLAASVRPVVTYAFFVEFVILTVMVYSGKLTHDQYTMIWNNEMQAIWASVVCFWFGQRRSSKGK